MKKFFQILTVVLALLAIGQVVTSNPAANAGEPHEHEPGV